jgi:hypothetical protein
MALMFNGLQFTKPGTYEFELMVDGRHVGSVPFCVVQAAPPALATRSRGWRERTTGLVGWLVVLRLIDTEWQSHERLLPRPYGAISHMTAPVPAYQGLSRSSRIPACVLSIEDLKRLFNELDTVTREVNVAQIDEGMKAAPVTVAADWERLTAVKKDVGVTMFVQGRNGEQLVLFDAATINRETLPDKIDVITFDSSHRYNLAMGNDPLNRFKLILDLREPPAFVGYDPWSQPTPNESHFEIIGKNQTWVAGVNDKVLTFLGARKRKRLWLHGYVAFSLLQWVVAMPASLWIVYRLDGRLGPRITTLPSALHSALLIYVFLLTMLVFRGLIYVLRWLFPIVELEGSRSKAVRALVGAVEIGIISALLYDILRAAI